MSKQQTDDENKQRWSRSASSREATLAYFFVCEPASADNLFSATRPAMSEEDTDISVSHIRPGNTSFELGFYPLAGSSTIASLLT